MSFPLFMKLPPELRVLVYRELLVVDTWAEPCRGPQTAILRTCKLVKKEAEDVLYSENQIEITIACPRGISLQTLKIPGRYSESNWLTARRSLGATLELLSTPCLAKFRRLRVVLIAEDLDSHEVRFQCSALAALISATDIKTINISLWKKEIPVICSALQPLADLCPEKEITFKHHKTKTDFQVHRQAQNPSEVGTTSTDKVLLQWFKTIFDVRGYANSITSDTRREAVTASVDKICGQMYKLEYHREWTDERVCMGTTHLRSLMLRERFDDMMLCAEALEEHRRRGREAGWI